MKLLKQIGVVFPVTQHMYLVVFYFISASLTVIGMKSGVCAGYIHCYRSGQMHLLPVSLSVFMGGKSGNVTDNV